MDQGPAIVFDCDGTLTDSHHVIVESMMRAFDRCNVSPPTDKHVRGVIGLSLPTAIETLAPKASEDQRDALAEAYKTEFVEIRHTGDMKETLYPGVRACLEALKGQGAALGIATGKSRRGLDYLLDAHNLRGFFDSLQCADGNLSKPNPQMLEKAMFELGALPQHTVMVGDSPFDIQMGLAAGTQTIGVGWSDHGPAMLKKAGAHGILNSFAQWNILLAHWEPA
jgi:phosphoglycolate phosphatase